MGRIGAILLALIVCGKCWAEAPGLSRTYSAAPLQTVWRAQVPTVRSTDTPPWITLYVSPTQTRAVYELVQGTKRTLFTGPGAARDADIRKRVLLMSGKQATIETRAIPVATVLVQTPGGRVEALDAETGVRRWSVGVGTAGQAEFPASMNDDFVAAINGSELYVIDAQTGKVLFSRFMTNVPGSGPLVLGTQAYVPGVRGVFRVYEMAGDSRRFPPLAMTSFGRITSPPLNTPHGVVWTTDRGSVFVSDNERVASRYQILGRTDIMGQPAYAEATKTAPARLFVAYESGYVLGADAKTGDALWGFLADSAIADAPFVADDVVLVPTIGDQLVAVNAETGDGAWVCRGVTRAAGHANGVVFGETFDGKLALIDGKTGTKKGTWRLEPGEHLVTNAISDRVYLASANGSLRCLRLPEAKWPTFHVTLPPTPSTSSETPTKDSATATDKATTVEQPKPAITRQPPEVEESVPTEPAAEEDPFGSEDPFGEGGEIDDPFAGSGGEPS